MTDFERKMRRRKGLERLTVHTFDIIRDDGARQVFWLIKPNGMTPEQAFESQRLHGPFQSTEQAQEDQRVTIFGEYPEVLSFSGWSTTWFTQ